MSETRNSQVCVDASLLLWALLPYPMSDNAQAHLARWQESQTGLLAPALLAFEITSSLRRLVYLGELNEAEGEAALANFARMGVRLSHRKSIFPLAWKLAKQHNRPRAYDTAYLALAMLEDCPFWTADRRLYNAVNSELSWVHWVGEPAA